MDLINKKLLQSRLRNYALPDDSRVAKIRQIIESYQISINSGNLDKTKEVSVQGQFLQHFFEEILGYSFSQRTPTNWTLEHEGTIQGGSADGILGFFTPSSRSIRVVVELKDAKTDLDKKQNRANNESPIDQAHRYAYGVDGCNWIIASNFREIRLYSKFRSKDYYEKFEVLKLLDDQELKKFLYLLSNGNLFVAEGKSQADGLVTQTTDDVKDISNQFYKDYKSIRKDFFNHLIENNGYIDKLVILEKTQKILDRFIFVLFAEDTQGLLPNNIAKDTHKLGINSRDRSDQKVWREFRNLFQDIDEGRHDITPAINKYNGGLFAKDDILDNLSIKDNIWTGLINLSEYDFESTLDVNILGHIFEQSINDLEELKATVIGESVDLKKTKRKKDGIFYTPEYITKYIVENTVGKWLEENPDQLTNIKILDPACGSGAFLNQAHKYLVQEYESRYQKEVEQKSASGHNIDLFTTNPADTNRSILLNNLYGVDLQPESVEISKLSLWLKTATKSQPLQNLDKNIKCGNSLIDDPQVAGERAFDWNKEFAETMQEGGFDVIIGNPPYVNVRSINATEKSGLEKKYQTAKGQYDLYILFIENAIKLLKNGGYMGFIIPNKFLITDYGKYVRKFIFENALIVDYKDLSADNVFPDASVYPILLILKKQTVFNKIADENYNLLKIFGFEEEDDLIEKMKKCKYKLGEICSIKETIHTGNIREKLIKTSKENSNCYKLLRGQDVSRYSLEWDGLYIDYSVMVDRSKGEYASLNDKKYFEIEKLLLRDIALQPTAAFDNQNYYSVNTLYSIQLLQRFKSDFNLKWILALINSQSIKYYFEKEFKDAHVSGGYLRCKKIYTSQLPIPNATLEQQGEIADLVDRIMDLKKQQHAKVDKFLKLLASEFSSHLGQKPLKINKKLQKYYELSFAHFLAELEKQKITLTLAQKSQWQEYFESEKLIIEDLENHTTSVDNDIESKVRALYGLDNDF